MINIVLWIINLAGKNNIKKQKGYISKGGNVRQPTLFIGVFARSIFKLLLFVNNLKFESTYHAIQIRVHKQC